MRTNKIGALVTLAALLALVALASPLAGANPPAAKPAQQGVRVAASVAPLLQYQGRLLDAPTGDPVADGTQPIQLIGADPYTRIEVVSYPAQTGFHTSERCQYFPDVRYVHMPDAEVLRFDLGVEAASQHCSGLTYVLQQTGVDAVGKIGSSHGVRRHLCTRWHSIHAESSNGAPYGPAYQLVPLEALIYSFFQDLAQTYVQGGDQVHRRGAEVGRRARLIGLHYR